MMRDRVTDLMQSLQAAICEGLEGIETATFSRDEWTRDGGGGGLTRVLAAKIPRYLSSPKATH